MRWLITILCLLFPLASSAVDSNGANMHDAWNGLVSSHVKWNAEGTASSGDYEGVSREASALSAYLKTLSEVDANSFGNWSLDEREAFLINAYNAATVQLILTRYPDLESIRELGGLFSSPWKKKFVELLGQQRSLDEIEHNLLRGASDHVDPRIHFAVNCASIGCPALRDEAYTRTRLRSQLQDQTIRFLSDRNRNRASEDGETLTVSKIFDWYGDDFSSEAGNFQAFLADYGDALGVNSKTTTELRAGELNIRFSDYDWSLNTVHP